MKPLIKTLQKVLELIQKNNRFFTGMTGWLWNNNAKQSTITTNRITRVGLLSGYFLMFKPPVPVSVGAEQIWIITVMIIIGVSFVGAIWGEDKWIEEWLNEPGYNDPDEFQEYRNPPPKKEMEAYDPEAEELEQDLTWWERWEEFWYSQWWWPREEESATEEVEEPELSPTVLPLREKDTRTWLVRWLDNATAELCKKPPEPEVKEEDVFDDMWDWTVNFFNKLMSPAPNTTEGNKSEAPVTDNFIEEEEEFEPETWTEMFTNFIKDRWWWRSLFGDDEPTWYNSYTSETDDDEDIKPNLNISTGVDDDDDDDDSIGGGDDNDPYAMIVPFWIFVVCILLW